MLEDRLDAGVDSQAGAAFGSAVSLQLASAGGRTRIAVGAPLEDIGGSVDAGAMYIYETNNGGPVVLLGRVDAGVDIQDDARLGTAVGVPSQGSVVAGAPGQDVGLFSGAGSAFAWELPGSVPTFDERIDGVDPGIVTGFGSSISVYARDMVVGAPGGEGRAYAYAQFGSQWNLRTVLTGEVGTRFGESVSTFGEVIAVGSPDGDVGGSPAGVIHLFGSRQSPVYGPITVLDAGSSPIDLGTSVAVMDGVVVAGDPTSGIGGVTSPGHGSTTCGRSRERPSRTRSRLAASSVRLSRSTALTCSLDIPASTSAPTSTSAASNSSPLCRTNNSVGSRPRMDN